MADRFDQELAGYAKRQVEESAGERRRRLTETKRHAEELFLRNVWWPMFGNFDRLHAEWEVPDFRQGFRYLDFAYMLPPLRIAIEIEGIGPHAKHADRRKFEDDHVRAAFLQAEGWKVIRFSYDTVNERPQLCRQILTLLIGKWSDIGNEDRLALTEREKAIIRLAVGRQRPITPGEVSESFDICVHTARRRLRELTAKGVFRVASGSSRARAYALRSEHERLFRGMEK
ncbi:DUF559 domain-containing protein [Paenibacillus sp.]|uniref:DUF559 domain-containing protein n=1 Tax=Paenibacillus sp. TaxID=58172 RepID=UPI0028117EA8|nr:DUF559 domain-containing protein [Paenibacillus sp.]